MACEHEHCRNAFIMSSKYSTSAKAAVTCHSLALSAYCNSAPFPLPFPVATVDKTSVAIPLLYSIALQKKTHLSGPI